MAFTKNFMLTPNAPFDLNLSAAIFSPGDKQVRAFNGGFYSQVLPLNGKLALATLASVGSVAEPKMQVCLKANQQLTKQDTQQASALLTSIFNLNFPLTDFYKEIQTDYVMASISQKLQGYRTPATSTAFEALVNSIVEQQIAIKVAWQIENRLAKRFGEKLSLAGDDFFLFPTPKQLALASLDDIRQCGLSQRKAQYIKEAAEAIVSGKLDLDFLKVNRSPQEIIAALDALLGIGVWTAELTLLKGM